MLLKKIDPWTPPQWMLEEGMYFLFLWNATSYIWRELVPPKIHLLGHTPYLNRKRGQDALGDDSNQSLVMQQERQSRIAGFMPQENSIIASQTHPQSLELRLSPISTLHFYYPLNQATSPLSYHLDTHQTSLQICNVSPTIRSIPYEQVPLPQGRCCSCVSRSIASR